MPLIASAHQLYIGGTSSITVSDSAVWTAWSSQRSTASATSTISWDSDGTSRRRALVSIATSIATSSATTDTRIWVAWNSPTLGTWTSATPIHNAAPARNLAAENAERIRIAGEQANARDRAERLLQECLSERQAEELRALGHFHLETIGKDGLVRRYRIERGRTRNVKQVSPEGRVLKTLCIHPVEFVPDADTMLAQKLYLEAAEEDFLRIANHS